MLNRSNQIRLTDAGETSAADLLREVLADRRMTPNELAQRIGVAQPLLARILGQKTFMTAEVARAIENETGVPAKVFLRLDARYRRKRLGTPD
ncbi:helix-turn-helix transcriptional regulator [Lacticaseibacillus daqingensis]|uniref:helix-turn-helix transcriptional regulator n=1 Tax=Lacticaseibacillus daqingensis TaxID=2486014 RepID=UPI000F7AED0E|nr:helix-turn-helix domain-containing protein [Lacticaseibacillus daqingensis]